MGSPPAAHELHGLGKVGEPRDCCENNFLASDSEAWYFFQNQSFQKLIDNNCFSMPPRARGRFGWRQNGHSSLLTVVGQTVLRSRTSLASRAAAIGSATTKATSSDGGSDNRSEEQPEAKPEGNLVPTKRRLRRHSRGRWGRTPSHEGSGRLRSSPGLGRWVRSSHVTPPQTNMAARVSSLCVRLRRLRLERSGSSPRHRNAHLEPWLEYTVTSTVTVHLV